jgi:protease-4
MKKVIVTATAFLMLLSGCTLVKVYLQEEIQPFQERVISGEGKDKILIVDLSGIITSGPKGSGFSGKEKPGMIATLREELDRARMDGTVKAVVLRIDSPGGGVTASDTLYHEIKKYKQDTGAAVVAHFMDMGTSGAYYAALAADKISAQPTTVTGSIGVIMLRIDATGLMQKIGIQAEQIASGDLKGMGSPFRTMTPQERKIFQGMIDSIYGRFVNIVAAERKLPVDKVKQLADGRIYTSEEAKTSGLIDGIGYLEDAIEMAKKQANLTQARVVTYSRPGEYRPTIYSLNLINIDMSDVVEPGVKFMYIWMP